MAYANPLVKYTVVDLDDAAPVPANPLTVLMAKLLVTPSTSLQQPPMVTNDKAAPSSALSMSHVYTPDSSGTKKPVYSMVKLEMVKCCP